MRGEECCAAELTLRLNLDVIVRAVARQRFADAVVVAIPTPGRSYCTARFRDVCRVLRRLQVGLITVRPAGTARVDFEAGARGGAATPGRGARRSRSSSGAGRTRTSAGWAPRRS